MTVGEVYRHLARFAECLKIIHWERLMTDPKVCTVCSKRWEGWQKKCDSCRSAEKAAKFLKQNEPGPRDSWKAEHQKNQVREHRERRLREE